MDACDGGKHSGNSDKAKEDLVKRNRPKGNCNPEGSSRSGHRGSKDDRPRTGRYLIKSE